MFRGTKVVITAPNTLELAQQEISESTVPDDCVVAKTAWSLISPGTEVGIYTGENPRVFEKGAWCAYPFNLGYTNLGRVVWVGSNAPDVAVGDWLLMHKPQASFTVLDPATDLFVPIAPAHSSKEALFARLAAIAYTAPFLCGTLVGKTAIVVGLGLIGNLAAQLFSLGGATVIGVDPVAARREIAQRCGITRTCTSLGDPTRRLIAESCDAAAADIFVDAVGHPDIILTGPGHLNANGKLVLLGSPKQGHTDISILEFVTAIHRKTLQVIGALENAIPARSDGDAPSRLLHESLMVRLVADGRLKTAPLLSHALPVTRAKEAYEGLSRRKNEYTGVVLEW